MFDLNPQFHNKPVEKLNQRFTNWSDSGFAPSHGNYRSRFNGGGGGGVAVQFRLETMEEADDSGTCSPPLWRSDGSPPESPVRSFNSNPRLLSPASRAQAIARGQREIMEMVESMPETSYELSLKDMVDQRRDLNEAASVDETQSVEEGEERSMILRGGQTDGQRWRKNNKSVKRQESNNKTGRIIVKNGSMNNNNKGLLINMFFPFSIGSKKKKTTTKSSFTTSPSFGNNSYHIAAAKLSPKVELLDKSGKDGDRRDWWWKKFTGSSDGESLRITSSSSSGGESTGRSGSSGSSGSSTAGSLHSNSIRNNSDCSHGCWSFFPSNKRKS